jgi:hypothetical protein
MTRFALALAAVLMLALSAGLMHGQPEGIPVTTGAASVRGFQDATDAFQSNMVVKGETNPSIVQRSADEEPPAPALLIYLGLILVGSTVSVILAHRRLQSEG